MSSNDQHKRSGTATYWLLLIPYIGLLWPAFYAFDEPRLFGFPFFYWYQFAWVIGSAVLTGVCLWFSKHPKDRS
ncbi:hypothetical protein BH10PSE17_BH10PSE17_38910 [soil metagenome]